jgi:hypothetical protein
MDNKALVSSLLEPHPLVKIHHVNRKPETTLIFFQFWMLVTVSCIIVMPFVLFVFSFLIDFLIYINRTPVVTNQPAWKVIPCFFPFIALYSIFPGWISAIGTMRQNKKEHEPFLQDKNIFHYYKALCPIYHVQKALLKTNMCENQVFEACLEALEALQDCTYYIKEKNGGKKYILALVKMKGLKQYKWLYRGEIFKFQIEQSVTGTLEINLESFSNTPFKGMDLGKNIKNIYEITNYLKCKLIENNCEVEIWLP